MFKTIVLLLLLTRTTYAATPAVYGVASVVPGLGQVLNGNIAEGAAWFGATVALLSTHDKVLRNNGWDLYQYNIYDAWKDAGGKPSQNSYWFQDYVQTFNVVNLADPFSVGFIGAAALSRSSAREKIRDSEDPPPSNVLSSIEMFSFVGFGEEALFRGFLYPSLSSWLTPWGGAIASSTLFAFAHVGATSGANTMRFVMGMLFCWQYSRNNYKLGPNIFAHSWYDQILIGSLNEMPSDEKSKWSPPIGVQITIPID